MPGCKPCLGQFARVIGNFERSGTFFGPFGLEVWSSCAVATATPANCPESSYGDDLAAGSEIGFALAAIPLAFMAAGLERCGRSEAQRVCPRSAEEPDLLFGQ